MRQAARRLRKVSRQRVRAFASLVLAQMVNLGVILVITRIYAPAAFGRYAALAAVAAVLGGASSLRLDVAATTADAADAAVLLRTARRLNITVGCLVMVAALSWQGLTAALGVAAVFEAVVLGAATAAIGLSTTLVYARVRDRRYGLVAASKLLTAVVQGAGQIGLGLFGRTAAVLLIATALGYAAAALLLARPAPHGAGATRCGVREVLNRHRGFMVASAPAGLINGLTMNVPLFIAAVAVGSAQAADLALALRVGALPSALFGQALMPILYGEIAHQLRSAQEQALASYDRALTGLSICGAAVLTALSLGMYTAAPQVLGPQWVHVGPMFLLLTPFLVGQFAVVPLSQTLSGAGFNERQLIWDVCRLGMAVAAFLPLVAGWSDLGVAVALYSAAMVGAYLAHVVLSRQALKGIRRAAVAVPSIADRSDRLMLRTGDA
ncbi:lipopolysaccharide biosynthesis protein [Micromonospora echinaurantiaca]|uniref:lipopolysaccharide biosynthesis protein n=1 Tax=Micromonospora echinaurantiaca TaxID=47857 RepID=UPI0037B09D83